MMFWLCLALAQNPEKPKISKVVLYKHGVGYFERTGKVRANQDVTLSFKANQMPDLLTSLFAVDLTGGKVEGITYDSKDPIEKQLENILIRIPDANALTQFVAQLKGARIEVKVGSTVARGSVMGIEPFQQKIDSSVVTSYKVVMLLDDGQIYQTNLLEVASLKLLDEPLQADLKRVLDIHMKSKYADRKDVKISFRGDGERNVVIGYLIETPIWKTTYRLIFAGDKPMLQGWAIVDNPTEEDWDGVDLTMVAGNPLSFVLDLYTPHYPARPVIGLQSLQDEMEREKRDGDKLQDRRKQLESLAKKEAPAEKARAAAAPAPDAAARPALGELMARGIDPIAQGAPVGELFAYSSKGPVSVPRGKAALIPIVNERIDGERALYSKGGGRVMNSYYLKNTSALTLEGGPVTVFEGSTSLGEGLLRRELKPGMKEMISYAIEAGVRVERAIQRHTRPMHRATLANGVLTMTYYQLMQSEYKVHNDTGKKYILFLDHAKTGGYTILEPAKPDEEMPDAYRLRIEIADKITPVKIEERTETSSSVNVLDYSAEQIRVWIQQPALSAKAKAFLDEVIAFKVEQARLQREQNGMQAEHTQLSGDENRYRENIRVLGQSPKERELREKYLEKLALIDDRMGQLRVSMQQTEQKRRDLEAAMAKRVLEFKE